MATVVNPTGDFYSVELPFDYGTPIEFSNETACTGSYLFSNIPQLCEGYSLVVSYKKAAEDAPSTFEVRVASNDAKTLFVLADGESKMLRVIQTHDTWYSQPWYFEVVDANEKKNKEEVVAEVTGATVEPEPEVPEVPGASKEEEAAVATDSPTPCKTVCNCECSCESENEMVVFFKGYKVTISLDETGAVQTSVTKQE